MESHASKDSPAQSVATSAKNGVMTEHGCEGKADHARQLPDQALGQRQQEDEGIEWNQNSDRDQEADQKLARGSRIFEGLAEHLRV